MKISKSFYIIPILTCLFISNITYADTCYDPNYNEYYRCGGDEYIAPIVAGLLLGAIISNDFDGGGHRYYHHGEHHDGNFRGGWNGRHH